MKQKVSLAILATLLFSTSADAYTYNQFKKARLENGTNWQLVKAYYQGMETGFLLANAELQMRNQPPLFCQPASLRLNDENLMDILETAYKVLASSDGRNDDNIIDAALFLGLQSTFPCGKDGQ